MSCCFLDALYFKHLKHYSFSWENNISEQNKGVAVPFTHLKTKERFFIDEKAQLDSVNEDLPAFSFELSYQKQAKRKKGWLFDPKKRHLFTLLWRLFIPMPLKSLPPAKELWSIVGCSSNIFVSLGWKKTIFNPKKEGYLVYPKDNKAEQPLNLILKLDHLFDIGIAKKLV